ncbi:MAG TPA: hypothetical protein VMZ71_00720 [Gemmataceae bacterium]|nr:hypothetical protein [Gemmataceae bacterium]
MISRRAFLGTVGASIVARPALAQPAGQPRKKLAIVTTEWRDRSHAWHMGERFLAGYPVKGKWHRPAIDVVSAYVDQFPKNDLSRDRARESGFAIHRTIAEALRCGTDKLAVDAVLIIGEHGDYPNNEFGQKKYPRYEFFKQVADVFKKDGRAVPVFNDKHLSWKWAWAKEMVDISRELKFPFLAGSSLPVTWRMPATDLPHGAEVEEMMCVAMGGVDSYDFHALEVIQCMAERRMGGETGVVALQALRGDAVWDVLAAGSWKAGGWNPRLFEACLCRSQTLAQAPTYSHRYPTAKQMRDWVKSPVAYRFEYADGLKATMLLLNGLVGDFTFAAKIKGETEPLSTLFYLPPNPNVVYSAALMGHAEEMFLTGKTPYPVERTLLTSGLVEAGMQSLAGGQKRLETPHLSVRYQAPPASLFWKN